MVAIETTTASEFVPDLDPPPVSPLELLLLGVGLGSPDTDLDAAGEEVVAAAEVCADTMAVVVVGVVELEVVSDTVDDAVEDADVDEDVELDEAPLLSSVQKIPRHSHCNPATAGQPVPTGHQ